MLFFLSTSVKTQLKKEMDFSVPNIQKANPDSALILSPELQDEKSEVIYINGNTKIYIAENTITNLPKVNSEYVVIQKTKKALIERKSPKKEKSAEKVATIKEKDAKKEIAQKKELKYLPLPSKEGNIYIQNHSHAAVSANPSSPQKAQASLLDVLKNNSFLIFYDNSGVISYSKEIIRYFSKNDSYLSRPPPLELI